MTSNPDVDAFLRDQFRSVWALELLLLLERNADRTFSSDDLVESLRASRAIVEQGIAGLLAGGLIVVEGADRVRYAPAGSDLRRLVEMARDNYASRPDAVRRVIVSGAASGVSAFADAFRLRGND